MGNGPAFTSSPEAMATVPTPEMSVQANTGPNASSLSTHR